MKVRSPEISKEESRIRDVYERREARACGSLYAWHFGEVQLSKYRLAAVWSKLFLRFKATDISNLEMLDIGCGNGGWLRQLLEWGAAPGCLHGIDLLEERIDLARRLVPQVDLRAVSAWPAPYPDGSMDIVTANTVFSSILSVEARRALADEMVRVLRPDGLVMIYDFRYNNPRNKDVVGIDRREIRRLFPDMSWTTRTLRLAPPLARRICPVSPLAGQVLESVVPMLRSHAVYAIRHRDG